MNLTIDIGNTRIKLAVFDQNEVRKQLVWDKWDLKGLKSLCKKYAIDKVALSSTAGDPEQKVRDYLKDNFYFIELNHKTKVPIDNLYKTPKTLGKDRLAAVIAAVDLYPGSNCLVIDAGTCITYDFIDKHKAYHGGTIAPGIYMRYRAMHEFTAKLPMVSIRKMDDFIGKDTKTSLRSGGQIAAFVEMQGFIDLYKSKFGKIKIILTGGDANYFAIHLKTKIFVHQNLVPIGLNKIIEYNAGFLD